MSSLGRVITFPIDGVSDAATAAASGVGEGLGAANRAVRRLTTEGAGEVDEWGRDPGLVRLAIALAGLRWSLTVGGDQRLPRAGAGLIVINTRALAQSAVFAAFAISRCVDRPVRFVGRRDVAVTGSIAQRLGGLLDDPREVAGALRAGELVVVGAAPSQPGRDEFQVGIVDHTLIGAAIATGTPVFPAAAATNPVDRRARIEIGPEAKASKHRRGPLHELELADEVREQIAMHRAELGDVGRDTLFDWTPFEMLARQVTQLRSIPSTVAAALRGSR